MSDAAIATIVTGSITIVGMVVGFLTLWVKLRYGVRQVEQAAVKADEAVRKATIVEGKLDANTATTESMDSKADIIVKQTNGAMDNMRSLLATLVDDHKETKIVVSQLAQRVDKIEEYNHESSHRITDAVNAVHLKLTEMAATQGKTTQVNISPPIQQDGR